MPKHLISIRIAVSALIAPAIAAIDPMTGPDAHWERHRATSINGSGSISARRGFLCGELPKSRSPFRLGAQHARPHPDSRRTCV